MEYFDGTLNEGQRNFTCTRKKETPRFLDVIFSETKALLFFGKTDLHIVHLAIFRIKVRPNLNLLPVRVIGFPLTMMTSSSSTTSSGFLWTLTTFCSGPKRSRTVFSTVSPPRLLTPSSETANTLTISTLPA